MVHQTHKTDKAVALAVGVLVLVQGIQVDQHPLVVKVMLAAQYLIIFLVVEAVAEQVL